MENPWKALSKVNPQRENGHRRIASDIWQALVKIDINASAYKVVLHVIDRSWGFKKLEAVIGYTQFMKATGLSKVSVRDGLRQAESKRLLVVKPGNFRDASTYLFNKHYDTWLSGKDINTGIDINTGKAKDTTPGKAKDTTPGKAKDTTPGKPLTSELSLPIETFIETIKKPLKKGSIPSPEKKGYGEFNNVLLNDEEYRKLTEKLGKAQADNLIEQLSSYMKQNPANAKKYVDHYATILNWSRKDGEKSGTSKNRGIPGNKSTGAFDVQN